MDRTPNPGHGSRKVERMSNHTPSILDALASYFHTSETWIVLGLIAIGLGILAGVFNVGLRWAKWTEPGDL